MAENDAKDKKQLRLSANVFSYESQKLHPCNVDVRTFLSSVHILYKNEICYSLIVNTKTL